MTRCSADLGGEDLMRGGKTNKNSRQLYIDEIPAMVLETQSHDLFPSFPQHHILPSVLFHSLKRHFSTIRQYTAHVLPHIDSPVLHHSDNGSLCSTSMFSQISFTFAHSCPFHDDHRFTRLLPNLSPFSTPLHRILQPRPQLELFL